DGLYALRSPLHGAAVGVLLSVEDAGELLASDDRRLVEGLNERHEPLVLYPLPILLSERRVQDHVREEIEGRFEIAGQGAQRYDRRLPAGAGTQICREEVHLLGDLGGGAGAGPLGEHRGSQRSTTVESLRVGDSARLEQE